MVETRRSLKSGQLFFWVCDFKVEKADWILVREVSSGRMEKSEAQWKTLGLCSLLYHPEGGVAGCRQGQETQAELSSVGVEKGTLSTKPSSGH